MQQKLMSNTDGRVTPAEYARSRGLNRSTVCRQIQRGKIPAHDGLIDPAEADEARTSNLSQTRGRRKPDDVPQPEDLTEFRLGQLAAANGLRRPENLLVIAETALGIGCTIEQAVTVARWYCVLVGIWVADDHELHLLHDHPEPDWMELAQRIGVTVTPSEVESWRKKTGRAIARWDKAHPATKERG